MGVGKLGLVVFFCGGEQCLIGYGYLSSHFQFNEHFIETVFHHLPHTHFINLRYLLL